MIATKKGKKNGDDDQLHDCAFVVKKTHASEESLLPSKSNKIKLLAVKKSEFWLTDGGASRHMTYRRDWLTEFRPMMAEQWHSETA